MFNLFGPEPEQFKNSIITQGSHICALIDLLTEKGILTAEDEDRFVRVLLPRSRARIDQLIKQKEDEAAVKFEKEHPPTNFSEFFKT